MDLKNELQKYIDDFRFCIIDENGVQKSSTWTIRQNNKEDSVFIYPKSLGEKLGISFHERGTSRDGNDSQYGIKYKNYRKTLEKEGFELPKPLRWTRPNNDQKIERVSSILFPTDHMTGEVYQFVNKSKPKITLRQAPSGCTIEVSIFSHKLSTEIAEQKLESQGYLPFFFMKLPPNEIMTVAFRQTKFDRSNLPKIGTYPCTEVTKQKIIDSKFLHGIYNNSPGNGEPVCLIEINGIKVNI